MSRRPIVMLAQTPPPFHGQAVMTQVLKDALEESFEVYHVRMDFSETVAENKTLRFSKVWKLFSILLETVRLLRAHRDAVLYYPPSPGHWVPVLRDWVLLGLCRPLAGCTVFHFHARGIGTFLEQHSWFPRRAWAAPEYAIVLGPSVRQDAEQLGAGMIHEIPYGIDVEHVDSPHRDGAPVRIFFAGFHTETKGILDVLETVRLLKERGVSFEVQTAGEWASDALRRRFFENRSAYGLEDCVAVSGLLTGADLQAAYAGADLFFFPTFFEHETFGVVVIEAMAHGLPAVVSNWPGPVDVVRDGETGFVCASRRVDAYADALQKLIELPSLRDAMGRAAKERYEQKYTRRRYRESVCRLFNVICEE